jgi:threonine aldolase
MIYMGCDYQEGAFPQILARYGETNLVQQPGYGEDVWTKRARDLIRAACRAPEAEVHLLVAHRRTRSCSTA